MGRRLRDPVGPSCVQGWQVLWPHPQGEYELAMQMRVDEAGRDNRWYALICTKHQHPFDIGWFMLAARAYERNKLWCPGCTPSAHTIPEQVAAPGPVRRALSEYHQRVLVLESSQREGSSPTETTRLLRNRSRAARSLVIDRSGGCCESPECASPDFSEISTTGDPILEVDHVQDLARDGEDHPANMIALCTNCHAVKTRGRRAEQLRKTLRVTATELHDKAMAEHSRYLAR
ncbi:HNH endonuclease [Embleya sp. NPDC008237]|uniref:HNH endonuclease n=1 Tax=Embleya sp. NPDC008237 TaxID=3363978 RepID=UPI0036E29829